MTVEIPTEISPTIHKKKGPHGKRGQIIDTYTTYDIKTHQPLESWPELLARLCGDRPLSKVANALHITQTTLIHWRKDEDFPRRSAGETRRLNLQRFSSEERLERRKQRIITKLCTVNEIRDNPIGYINQKLKDWVSVKDSFNDLRKKGLKIKTIQTFYHWLEVLGISALSNLQAKVDIYQQAKQVGLLTKLTKNQQAILEMVFEQGLTVPEAARRRGEKEKKTVSPQSIRQSFVGALRRLEKLLTTPLTTEEPPQFPQTKYLYQVLPAGRLTTRIVNVLLKNKYENLDDLITMTEDDMYFSISGVGRKGAARLSDALYGLYPERERSILELTSQDKEVEKPIAEIDMEAFYRWQRSLIENTRLDQLITDKVVYNQLFYNGITLEQLITMSDKELNYRLGGDKNADIVKEALIEHSIVPTNSRYVLEIDALSLSWRARQAFAREGITKIEQICKLTDNQLKWIKGIGEIRFEEIKSSILRFMAELDQWKQTNPSLVAK